ncbi:hypothetical protein [Priestia megaterium]|uniref:hypothetical protein n=1 Tax=Priestia megaterium TaxID=1404 RepID=UPI001CB90B52|nr:hypothetical protein [Priestia megaterium]
MKNNVKEKFNAHASQYDEQRRNLFLVFLIFIPFPFLFFTFQISRFALDIGAGTDCFLLLSRKIPRCSFHVD